MIEGEGAEVGCRKAGPPEHSPWDLEAPACRDGNASLGDREAQGAIVAQSHVVIAVIAPAPETFNQMISPPKPPPEEPPPY